MKILRMYKDTILLFTSPPFDGLWTTESGTYSGYVITKPGFWNEESQTVFTITVPKESWIQIEDSK